MGHPLVVAAKSKAKLRMEKAGHPSNVYQIYNPASSDATQKSVFQYDLLNRLSQANSLATSGTNCWGEVYAIDAWGNDRSQRPGRYGKLSD